MAVRFLITVTLLALLFACASEKAVKRDSETSKQEAKPAFEELDKETGNSN